MTACGSVEVATKLTHCRWDKGVCATPGLFKSLSPGEREGKLDVKHTYTNKTGARFELHFVGPEPLGIDDLRVFQGLIAAAAVSGDGGRGNFLSATTESTIGRVLRDGLDNELGTRVGLPMAPPNFDDGAMVEISYAHLAEAIGYKSTRDKSTIRASIRRLFSTTIFSTKGNQTNGSRLLSSYDANDSAEEICVAINPKMALAILGDGNFAKVNLTEARLLATPAARLIHQRLSWIDDGVSRNVGLDTLCGYAWPTPSTGEIKRREHVAAMQLKVRRSLLLREIAETSDEAASAAAQKALEDIDATQLAEAINPQKVVKRRESQLLSKHRLAARVALTELVAVGWCIKEDIRPGMFTIKRPSMPMHSVDSAVN